MEPALLLTLPRWGMTRSGELYRQPTPELRIDESDGGAWPTARTTGLIGGSASREMMRRAVRNGLPLRQAEEMAGCSMWPTPQATDSFAVWSEDDQVYITSTGMPRRINRQGVDGSTGLARLATWPTPTADDASNVTRASGAYQSLTRKALPRATPQARDWKGTTGSNRHSPLLPDQVTGKLNPSWVEQLMGYPDDWTVLDGPPAPVSLSTPGKPPARRQAQPTAQHALRRWGTQLCRKLCNQSQRQSAPYSKRTIQKQVARRIARMHR
jgi:hypothetical protein